MFYIYCIAYTTKKSFTQGTTIKIKCKEALKNIKWIFNEGSLPSNVKSYANKLVITNATVENEGKYVCEGNRYKRLRWTYEGIPYAEYHILIQSEQCHD